jgi:hypothetical protein
VAALVEREHVVVRREVGRDLVPAVRRLRAAVEEKERRIPGRTPVEEVEAEAVQRGGDVRSASAQA